MDEPADEREEQEEGGGVSRSGAEMSEAERLAEFARALAAAERTSTAGSSIVQEPLLPPPPPSLEVMPQPFTMPLHLVSYECMRP
jgi:hypothetical protein